jgi:hypothetical protein
MSDELSQLYEDVERLAAELTAGGETDTAEALRRAMYGSTSGEILTDIYAALRDSTPVPNGRSRQTAGAIASIQSRIAAMLS